MEIEVRVLHSQRETVSSRIMSFLNAAVLPCWFSFSQNKNHRGDANAPRWDNAQASVLQEPLFIYLFFDPSPRLQRLITHATTMQWWMRPSPGCQQADWAEAECPTAEAHGRCIRLCKLVELSGEGVNKLLDMQKKEKKRKAVWVEMSWTHYWTLYKPD